MDTTSAIVIPSFSPVPFHMSDNSDLPKLQSIELGALTFCGDCRNGRMTIQEKPYYSMNTLIMRGWHTWLDE